MVILFQQVEVRNILLRQKLIISFTILIMCMGILIGKYLYDDARVVIIEHKKDEIADTINRIDINITTRVREVTRFIDDIGRSSEFQRMLVEGDDFSGTEIQSSVRTFNNTFDMVSSISIYDIEGNLKFKEGVMENNVLNKKVLLKLKSSPNIGRWEMIEPLIKTSSNEKSKIVYLNPVMENVTGKAIGVIAVEVNTSSFTNLLLNNQSDFKNHYTVIVNKEGNVITSNKNIQHGWLSSALKSFNEGTRNFETEWRGDTYYIYGQYNGITGWRTFSSILLSELFPNATILRNNIVLIVFIAIAIACIIVYYLSLTYTRPIEQLSVAMKRVQDGEYSISLPVKRNDEIGKMLKTFNYMTDTINHLISEVYEVKIAQKNAELGALQAQINPHFLYNSLDSLNWMLIDRGDYDISDLVISLSEILKYSVHGGKAFVTLEEELKYIESYLQIQKNRFEERLTYEIKREKETDRVYIPRMILQPIVENAILHGLDYAPKGGDIKIYSEIVDNRLLIVIQDNGAGMDEEQLGKLKNKIKEGAFDSDSIGIQNVERRIRLYYGAGYGLSIESVKDQGTKVMITLRARNNEEMEIGKGKE